ncbi:MAG: hypothetical protein AB1657_04030 [Candidatus Micrarchaeota archaeon]
MVPKAVQFPEEKLSDAERKELEKDLKEALSKKSKNFRKIQELVLLRSITSKGKLTEKDVENIGRKIKAAIAEKHR